MKINNEIISCKTIIYIRHTLVKSAKKEDDTEVHGHGEKTLTFSGTAVTCDQTCCYVTMVCRGWGIIHNVKKFLLLNSKNRTSFPSEFIEFILVGYTFTLHHRKRPTVFINPGIELFVQCIVEVNNNSWTMSYETINSTSDT